MNNDKLKEQIRKQVKTQIYSKTALVKESSFSIDHDAFRNTLVESMTAIYGEEIAEEANANCEELLTEGLVDTVVQKGLERYPMMFLERGDQRYFFVKTTHGVDWVYFKGQTLEDRGSFDNDEAGEQFIYDRQGEGFKAVKRDGGIKKFFKAIGRGASIMLKVLGGFGIIAAVFSLVFVMIFSTAPATGGAATGMIAAHFAGFVANLTLGLTAIGGGWVIGKLSKKKAEMGD